MTDLFRVSLVVTPTTPFAVAASFTLFRARIPALRAPAFGAAALKIPALFAIDLVEAPPVGFAFWLFDFFCHSLPHPYYGK